MATCKGSRPKALVVPMEGDSYKGVWALLEFIYSVSRFPASMPDLVRNEAARGTAIDMIAPAHKYGFDNILRYCDDIFSSWAPTASSFSCEHIASWISFADKYKLEKTLAALELQLIHKGTDDGFQFASKLSPQSLARLLKGFEIKFKQAQAALASTHNCLPQLDAALLLTWQKQSQACQP
ncbi:hypothetical protein WJX84_005749 [Apatococcus fuscideae]|uniref:Uncharacterized protein n=1 Tax=Apatococcus fuscideae TaxID=2026836 RepID=A0AAW1TF43_9CHLO